MNELCTIGRLTKDPELKETENGNKVVNFVLAVDQGYKDKDGKQVVDFAHFSLWNKLAENFCNIAKKGSSVNLKSHVVTERIETKDGGIIYALVPKVDSFKHLAYSNNKGNEIEEEQENEMTK